MDRPDPRYTFDRVVRMVFSAITLAVLIWLLRYLSDVLVPFAVAVVLAYILNPLVTVFERKTKSRGIAVAITMFGLFVITSALLVIIVPLIVGQVARFRDNLMRLQADVAESIIAPTTVPPAAADKPVLKDLGATDPNMTTAAETTPLGWTELQLGWDRYRATANTKSRPERFQELRGAVKGTYVGYLVDDSVEYLRSDNFRGFIASTAKSLAMGGLSVIGFLLNVALGITGFIVVLIYLMFLLIDYPEYSRSWAGFLPPNYREPVVDFFAQFDAVLRRYLRGQSIVALITGTLECIGFTIIGLPMAVPLGIFIGLLTMVPYLPAIAIVPAAILAALRAIENGSSLIVSLLLTYMVMLLVQVIQDAIVTPKVIGKATGLRPVAILLGVFIWGKLLGFLGVVLAIPLTCLGIAYYRRYILERNRLLNAEL